MSCISAAGNASHRRPLLQDRPFDDWRSRARELDMTRSAGALAAPAFVLCCQSESEPYRIARLSLNSRRGNTSAGTARGTIELLRRPGGRVVRPGRRRLLCLRANASGIDMARLVRPGMHPEAAGSALALPMAGRTIIYSLKPFVRGRL